MWAAVFGNAEARTEAEIIGPDTISDPMI